MQEPRVIWMQDKIWIKEILTMIWRLIYISSKGISDFFSTYQKFNDAKISSKSMRYMVGELQKNEKLIKQILCQKLELAFVYPLFFNTV